MRRLFIIRKDLHLTPGKLAAMVAHCAEGYWIYLIRKNLKDENGEDRCTVGIWFKPLADDVAHSISKKYQLYKG